MPIVSIEPPDAPALDVFYADEGSGRPVVLIGGLSSTNEVYAPQISGLSEQFRVIAPDNRGSGRTLVHDDDGDRAIDRMARDVFAVLDALALDRVHLVGTSMGGMIVQEFALAHPERLATLTIGCSHGGSPGAIPPSDETIGIIVTGSGAQASEDDIRANNEMMFHPSSLGDDRASFEYYVATKALRPHSSDELERRMHAIMAFDAWERLPTLNVPTLVITGDDDRLIPPDNSRRLAERIPGARLTIIPNAGHIFWLEQSAVTNRALLEHFTANS